jgi:phenylacetate-coenzyme A ligase PaaK-like adenylate-forming protein
MTVEEMKAFMQEEMRIKNAHDMMIETLEDFRDLPFSHRHAIARAVVSTFKRIKEEQV